MGFVITILVQNISFKTRYLRNAIVLNDLIPLLIKSTIFVARAYYVGPVLELHVGEYLNLFAVWNFNWFYLPAWYSGRVRPFLQ